MRSHLPIVALTALALGPLAGRAAAETFAFDIPAGNAELAITEYSRQAHRQIIVPGDALVGITSPALKGNYDPATALSLLLKGTDLVVASDDGKITVLKQRAVAPSHVNKGDTPAIDQQFEAVTVTGYRASLANATMVKRNAIGLTDAIFAEDIGKFPDTNIAESINRIPGILMSRDANGEGILIAIRGLSTNFTKILLNGAPISIATSGILDSGNNNREVDLNMFPAELFTSLTVDKTSRAEFIEGGAAGTVNMRSRRAFDDPGLHVSYVAQGVDNTNTNGMGALGALIASDTWSSALGQIGALIGIASQHTYTVIHGWEDGNAGWVTPSITNPTLCGASQGCDLPGSTVSIGGNAMTIAPAVPANVIIPGYAAGTTTDAAMLMALNPGLSMTDISNMLLPRLPREMYQRGTRDRYNLVVSLEVRPNDNTQFYIDFISGRRINNLDRSAVSWGVRAGSGSQPMIPMNVKLDRNGVVTSGRFANAQFGLEARPYREMSDFFSINPGLTWQITERLEFEAQVNVSRSHFRQEAPTAFVATCPSAGNPQGIPGCQAPPGGVFVDFTNLGGIPRVSTNIDLNDPANFQWNGGRANIRTEKRYTTTQGAHLKLTYGGAKLRATAGAAFDLQYRSIVAIDFLDAWQQALCGGGISPNCTGIAGSLVPQPDLASYLYPGPAGFVAVDYRNFMGASAYQAFSDPVLDGMRHNCVHQPAGNRFAPAGVTGATSGCITERALALFGEIDGEVMLSDHSLKYDVGLRWVETRQAIDSPVRRSDGSFDFSSMVTVYQAFLPSATVAFDVTDDVQAKASFSRTMTRANASQMISNVNFSDPTSQEAMLGNPDLKPYIGNNVDLSLEYYLGGESYIGVSLFRKWIGGFTTTQIVTRPFSYLAQFGINWNSLTSPQRQALSDRAGCTSDANCPAEINVSQPLNAPGIETISGLELSYVQSLDPLLKSYGLSGFGLNGNLTVIRQSSSGSAATHAVGVAPYSYNVTGYYEQHGVTARLSYTYMDYTYGSGSNQQNVCLPTIQAASMGCPDGAYLFGAPYGQADFASSVKLSTLFGPPLPTDPELTFNVQNVFHAKRHSYFQYRNAYHLQYAPGTTFLFGVHGTI